MLIDVTKVEVLARYQLQIWFEDGVCGIVDLSQIVPFEGVFSDLTDPAFFAQVAVHPELGTICWPNGADLDSDMLYSIVTKEEISILEGATVESLTRTFESRAP